MVQRLRVRWIWHALAVFAVLVVGLGLSIPREADAADPPPGRFVEHVVREGETLSGIARAYGVPLSTITTLNGLADPDHIAAGQRLRIPVVGRLESPTALPAPLVSVQAFPLPAAQGSTLSVRVVAASPVPLGGRLDGQRLAFAEGPDGYWALVGIHPLAEPGCHVLTLEVADAPAHTALWEACIWVVEGAFAVQRIPLSPALSGILADVAAVQEEARRLSALFAQVSGPPLWRGPFAWPVDRPDAVSAPFGDRRAYGNGPATSFHEGVDFDALAGAPVRAPARGRVVLAEDLWVRGKAVILDHGQGVFSGYWHLSEVEVRPGQWVWPGTLLGHVGSTGLSTGPHLHWEVRVNGVPVNPAQWVAGDVDAWPTWPGLWQRALAPRWAAHIPR
ncbi:MAG: peptidoglycan DD-metalloendopeptidase family protein [Anaerolineae bacterium]